MVHRHGHCEHPHESCSLLELSNACYLWRLLRRQVESSHPRRSVDPSVIVIQYLQPLTLVSITIVSSKYACIASGLDAVPSS